MKDNIPEDLEEIEFLTDHPMESLFDIEPNTTLVTKVQMKETAPIEHTAYDDKDNEIEDQFDQVYKAALNTFHNTMDDTEEMEPRYRNSSKEIAVQFLNTALAAAEKKANLKTNKDKITHSKITTKQSFTQNNIVTDHNQLLKMLREKNTKDVTPP